jgi:hypothetical protein
MRHLKLGLLLLSLLSAGWAQGEGLPRFGFETGTEGWLLLDQQATLKISRDPGRVFAGEASLHFSFAPRLKDPAQPEDHPGALGVPLSAVGGAQVVRLALYSQSAGPLVVILREQNEAVYTYMCYLQADRWHQLELPLADFIPGEDSRDDNGRLDADQIAGLGLLDVTAGLMDLAAQGGFPFYVTAVSRRELWVDEVEFLARPPRTMQPAQPAAEGQRVVVLDDFEGEPARFGILGGRDLRLEAVDEPALAGQALRLDYRLPAQTALTLIRFLPAGLLAGAQHLSLGVRSSTDISLIVAVEEEDKSRYSTVVDIKAGEWQRVTVALADFVLEENSRDDEAGLQLESIRSLHLADATAMIAGKETATTLWLDDLTALVAP